MQSCFALVRSRSGSGGGPFLFAEELALSLVAVADPPAADLSRLDLDDGFRLP